MRAGDIARTYHESYRVLQFIEGGTLLPPWHEASQADVDSTVDSVQAVLAVLTDEYVEPRALADYVHLKWCEQKRAAGWRYGPVRDNERKVHPLLVDFGGLSLLNQAKDILLVSIVQSLRPLPESPV